MPWYEDWFNSDGYELVYDQRDLSEAEQLADLIETSVEPQPGAEILDVGTGRGRHARVLARRGYRVTGLDLAEKAIATARERSRTEGLTDEQITFVQGDMRLPHFQDRFDGVVNLFTSFGFFEDDADHQRAISSMAAAMKPGGWLVQDFLNAPYVRAQLVPQSEKEKGGIRVRQERWIDGDSVRKRISLTQNGEARTFVESVRLLAPEDFRRMYGEANLEIAQRFGDYDGNSYSAKSPRLILIARKEGGG